jgi:hypothetical protein
LINQFAKEKSAEKVLSYLLTQRVLQETPYTSEVLKLDGMRELDVDEEDSAGVPLLVVPDGMIFPAGEAKNNTSVPISSL